MPRLFGQGHVGRDGKVRQEFEKVGWFRCRMHIVDSSLPAHEIAIRFFEPSGDLAGTVVIAPAMGIKQDYYAALASWLSKKGFLVATFDYRGTGLSLEGSLRGFEADIFDWANDGSSVVDALVARAPDKPIYWIGHSLGGQIVPFVKNIDIVSKVITVACGSGYWLESTWQVKLRAWWLWFVVVPFTLPLFGYFPGKRLRIVSDLPKNVMAQWRRWCLNSEYCVGAEGHWAKLRFAAFQIPIISFAIEDDEMISRKNFESLHSFFTQAPLKMQQITPAEIGVDRIGHFGFFRRKFEQSLWKQYLLAELNN